MWFVVCGLWFVVCADRCGGCGLYVCCFVCRAGIVVCCVLVVKVCNCVVVILVMYFVSVGRCLPR